MFSANIILYIFIIGGSDLVLCSYKRDHLKSHISWIYAATAY